MVNIGCLVGQAELLVLYLGGPVLTVDMDGAMKKIRVTSGFRLQVMILRSLGVSGTCKLNIYCGTSYMIS